MFKQTNSENKGITDIVGDYSLTNKGFMYHSGMDFTPEMLGEFCDFFYYISSPYDKTVIELGCGSAVLSQCFSDSISYIGLDGNPDGGIFCKGTYLTVDLAKPFELEPPVQADLVMSFQFFEHIEREQIEPIIKKADELLKPGGTFFSVIDNIIHDQHLIRESYGWWCEQIERYTNWTKVEITPQFRDTYYRLAPEHWKPNLNDHVLVWYRK